MAVIVGSARIDEYGGAAGGTAGDQKQSVIPDYMGEVSMQDWYLHDKGWIVLRAKDPVARDRIAQDMEYACNNKNIGYDQSQNQTLYWESANVGYDCSKVTSRCETDCARLVRVCVLYAGIQCADFYTGNEADVLVSTGQFEKLTDARYTQSSKYLMRGDILVTKTKGHTVVVLTDGKGVKNTDSVAQFQDWLNRYYPNLVRESIGELLATDNSFGPLTRRASLTVWKYMANKYYGSNLDLKNPNFYTSCKSVAEKINVEELKTHATLVVLLEGDLAGKGYYNGSIDYGIVTDQLLECLTAFNRTKGIQPENELTAETWYELYN